MPELPEVETIKRDLQQKIVGRTILTVTPEWPGSIRCPSAEEFTRLLRGQKIEEVSRRGKYLLLRLSNERMLVIHLKMTGQLLVRGPDDAEDRFVRVRFKLDDGRELRFADLRKFGRLALYNSNMTQKGMVRETRAPYLEDFWKLGPEPLSADFTLEAFTKLIRSRSARMKSLLLNQFFLAGLGNIYADEALFKAGIHPLRKAESLTEEEIRKLYEAIKDVLVSAIGDRGTSTDNFRDTAGEPGFHQFHLYVYQRTGQPCSRCGTLIERMKLGGRSTHYCPKCQLKQEGQ